MFKLCDKNQKAMLNTVARQRKRPLSSLWPSAFSLGPPTFSLRSHLRFAPDLVGNRPHESHLGALVVVAQRVAALVGAEAVLRADGDALKRLLDGLAATLRDKLGCLLDARLDLVLVLERA